MNAVVDPATRVAELKTRVETLSKELHDTVAVIDESAGVIAAVERGDVVRPRQMQQITAARKRLPVLHEQLADATAALEEARLERSKTSAAAARKQADALRPGFYAALSAFRAAILEAQEAGARVLALGEELSGLSVSQDAYLERLRREMEATGSEEAAAELLALEQTGHPLDSPTRTLLVAARSVLVPHLLPPASAGAPSVNVFLTGCEALNLSPPKRK